jgi:hypothetical protein
MPRPKLKETREKFIVRLSNSEKKIIEAKAKASELTLSAYMRQTALNKQIPAPIPTIHKETYIELCGIKNYLDRMSSDSPAHSAIEDLQQLLTTINKQLQGN